jgi:hypothetical protein
MNPFSIFTHRVRGFRVLDILALSLLMALALGSYAFKTFAGAEGADTADVQVQIDQEGKRIRLLKAEIAHLEDPGRIERLSVRYLGLQTVDPKHDVAPGALAQIATRSDEPVQPPARP